MTEAIVESKIEHIRHLNDLLRIEGTGGRTVLTRSISALPPDELIAVLRGVAAFTAFDQGNDPHGEHDCAVIETGGHQVIWQIDYYDLDLRYLSPDPTNPDLTRRILTIMLAEEY